jgi:hypothetical protein
MLALSAIDPIYLPRIRCDMGNSFDGLCRLARSDMGARPQDYLELDAVVRKIAGDYGVTISGLMGEKHIKGIYIVPIESKKAEALRMLEGLKPGLWLWVSPT